MRITIEITEADIKRLVLQEIQTQLNDPHLTEKDIHFEVKSKQNWKSEWEEAAFRARVDK